MFCSHCGNNLEPGAKFCPNCGQNVPAQLNSYSNYTSTNPVENVASAKPNHNFLKIFIPIISSLLIVFIGAILVFVFYFKPIQGNYYYLNSDGTLEENNLRFSFWFFGISSLCDDTWSHDFPYKKTGDYTAEEIPEYNRYNYKSGYKPMKFIFSPDFSKISVYTCSDGEYVFFGNWFRI